MRLDSHEPFRYFTRFGAPGRGETATRRPLYPWFSVSVITVLHLTGEPLGSFKGLRHNCNPFFFSSLSLPLAATYRGCKWLNHWSLSNHRLKLKPSRSFSARGIRSLLLMDTSARCPANRDRSTQKTISNPNTRSSPRAVSTSRS